MTDSRIKLGPAGNCDKDIMSSLQRLKNELKLDAQEVEFTYGVKMSIETAKQAGELAQKLDIELSVHAPYYINLLSEEKAKRTASIKRILDSCERAHYLHAVPVVFHPGYYGKYSEEEAYEQIKATIIEMQRTINSKKWNSQLYPETTGKKSQFGSLEELKRLSKETDCGVCVDFAHIEARNGSINYDNVMEEIKSIKRLHAHFSGIEYTSKGERNHIITPEKKIEDLLKALLKHKVSITIINESPITWKDSLKMKKILERLR